MQCHSDPSSPNGRRSPGLLQENFDNALPVSIKTVAQIRSQICRQPLSRRLLASKLFLTRSKRICKLRHRLWSSHEILFNPAAIDRFAVALFQPVDQRSARAEFCVVTISRRERLALDCVDQRSVLFECAGNQEEAFACKPSQWSSVSRLSRARANEARLFAGRRLLVLSNTTVTINRSARRRVSLASLIDLDYVETSKTADARRARTI